MFMDTASLSFLPTLHQTPVFEPPGVATGRRFSEADALRMVNTQNATMSLGALEYRPTPPTYPPPPEQLSFSMMSSRAQSLSNWLIDTSLVSPSQTQGGFLASADDGDTYLLPTSSSTQGDLANVEASPGLPSAIGHSAPSHDLLLRTKHTAKLDQLPGSIALRCASRIMRRVKRSWTSSSTVRDDPFKLAPIVSSPC
jgi:hypothetical protein